MLFIISLILIAVNIFIIFYDIFPLRRYSYVIYFVNADNLAKFLDKLILSLYEEDGYEVIEDYYIKKDSAKEFIKFSNGIRSIEIAIFEYTQKIKRVKKDCCIEECLRNEKVFQELPEIRFF